MLDTVVESVSLICLIHGLLKEVVLYVTVSGMFAIIWQPVDSEFRED